MVERGSSVTSDVAAQLEVALAKMEVPASFELLHESDIWICDMGASSHSCNTNLGATNVRESES